jgi:UDP-N-acetylglucosamine 1-carboxyvinyltransferase
MESGYVEARAPDGLTGGRVVFPNTSVGATENILMAAVLAKGQTEIFNAAREPEIEDLALCLIEMGADISGIGSEKLTVNGRDILDGAHYTVLPDRIEAGTYAMAAAMTKGDILLLGARLKSMHAVIDKLRLAGVRVFETAEGLRVFADNRLEGVDVITEPYPGFPTDLQAQMTAMMSTAEGAAMITETIFENRFMHIPELARMGANVTVHGASSLIRGVDKLAGAPVMATDLRASASLVLAGLIAEGETLVDRVYHIDRGYERIEEKLVSCGAEIERVKE